MHYQQAIAELRALGFTATKFGYKLRVTHRKAPRDFDLRFPIDGDGLLPISFDTWLTNTKAELAPRPTIANFQPGTCLRHKSDPNGLIYIITENFGDRATGVATRDFTNPDEWEIVK